ncbi:MAG: uridylate kinase [Methanomicrobiales archaeon]|nr:uridylate kinase [Methanomicrobiales archaeon]
MKRDRFDIANKLQGESLVRKGLLERYEGRTQIRLMPELNVIKIGGHGIIDYGKDILVPLLEEIGELSLQNQILVVTGGGVRVRHILDVGLDLGMPTGILAELAGKVSEQNAIMVATLLSQWHGTRIHTGDILDLPMLLSLGVLPVTHGTPPYGLYEQPPEIGSIPPNRTDTGAFLAAEVLGAKNLILVKNVDGLYTDNPFLNKGAELIHDIPASELLAMNLEDMVLERRVVELLRYARNIHEVKIVNGHKPGSIRKVLAGENPGTVIRAR